jgi:hypothetical protein
MGSSMTRQIRSSRLLIKRGLLARRGATEWFCIRYVPLHREQQTPDTFEVFFGYTHFDQLIGNAAIGGIVLNPEFAIFEVDVKATIRKALGTLL